MKKKIIAICGSTRQYSINLELLEIIAQLYQETIDFEIVSNLDQIPHFNPDLDNPSDEPPHVLSFRNQLKSSDAILICTPEYAMGVPGTLKNAIDWTVSSMEFSHKSTALITASSLGEKAHPALLETLKVIEAKIDEKTSLLISTPRTKIKDGVITDDGILLKMRELIANLMN
jgi:chromate reductase, NAD(P)H dehydrogenase (quinone)